MRFDCLAQFSVLIPILSLAAHFGRPVGPIQLCCVQTTGIQEYSLQLAACTPGVLLASRFEWHASRVAHPAIPHRRLCSLAGIY